MTYLHSRTVSRRPRGFTLIEVLVVLAIIGLLVGLILPTVQAGREAARRATCSHNLRQIGLAMNAYVAAMGVYPPGYSADSYSHLVMILPYLEQGPLYHAFNFHFRSSEANPLQPNFTASSHRLETYLCPSDAVPTTPYPTGWTNYAGNAGVGVSRYGYNGLFDLLSSMPIGPADLTDGTSTTAASSEVVLTYPRDFRHPKRSVFRGPYLATPDDFEAFVEGCRALDPGTARLYSTLKGREWSHTELGQTYYVHALNINENSCGTPTAWGSDVAATAGSFHPHGANTLFADGHVRFLADSGSLAIWRAIGSRNGREVVSGDP